MVCVTGDVHQRSYRGTDSPFSPQTEVELAFKFGCIAQKHGIKFSLFLTGKACEEEPQGVKRLADFPNCEIGGHTYAAFRDPWSRIFKKVWGTPWGTKAHQLRDIQRTIECIEKVSGQRIQAWRNHSYIQTVDTESLLENCDIHLVSDEVSDSKMLMEWVTPTFRSVPINVLPDHEHLLHGKYQPGKTKPARLQGRVSITKWVSCVKKKVCKIGEAGGTATILVHPLCMEVADGMVAFEELCQYVQELPTCWISEVQ